METKTVNQWCDAVYANAKEKGWYNEERETGTMHMLMVSEVAEATEASRAGKPPVYLYDKVTHSELPVNNHILQTAIDNPSADIKPEGEAVELADCVISVMDYFAHKGWNLEQTIALKHSYNKTRSFKHGGKTY
jgi:hypothetical protein